MAHYHAMVPPRLRLQLAHTIRALRIERGISQERLAQLVNIHRTHMGAIERGATALTIDKLESIARGLGMPAWELLQQAESGQPLGPHPPRLQLIRSSDKAPADGGRSSRAGRRVADRRKPERPREGR